MREAILQQLFILEYRKTIDLVLKVYYDRINKSFKTVLRGTGRHDSKVAAVRFYLADFEEAYNETNDVE